MERPRSFAALSFAAIAFACAMPAQWTPVPAATPPPSPLGAVLVPWQNGELLLFGGDAITNPAATEWSWNGIRWAPVTTPVPRRDFSPIARNEADGSLLLCGGVSSAGTTLNDTWRFDAGTWTQLSPANVPTNQPVFLAHEPGTDDMILLTQGAALTYETWRFTAGDWTLVNTFQVTAPVAALFADTVRSEVCMLVSGTTLTVRRLAGLAWQDVAQLPSTPGPTWAAFDSDRGRAVVLQVQPAGTWRTFEYDGVRLVAQPVATVPSTVGLGRGALAYHAQRHEAVLAGGAASIETWRWSTGAVPMATAYGAPCVMASFQLGLAPGDSPEPGGVHRLLATGGGPSALTLSLLGFSHVQSGAVPLPLAIPIGTLGCQLRVDPLVLTLLGVGTPVQQVIAVPNMPSLLGARYDAQCVQFDATGVTDATNGLEVQIGRPLPANVLLETFASDLNRDPIVSGDTWGNGSALPVAIGGDGRHGSFSLSLLPPPSGNVYTWDTDNFTIPASNTLTGQAYPITVPEYFFTDFVIPANVTVRMTGLQPVRIYVRGKVVVQGTIDVSGRDQPSAANVTLTPPGGAPTVYRRSNFDGFGLGPVSPGPGLVAGQFAGQPGTLGECGGQRGGQGGCEGNGINPQPFNGVELADGQPGLGVFTLPGHVNAAAAGASAGLGSECNPPTGVTPLGGSVITVVATQFRDEFSRGGSGGGFTLAGGVPTTLTPAIPLPAIAQPVFGVVPAGGAAFPLFPYPPVGAPPGYQSLTHFLVGGAGGGGGGSHPFASAPAATAGTDVWTAGHGGTGGGGALALRGGGDVTVSGQLVSRGGDGVLIRGDDPALGVVDLNFGISSPGGGGSGGSFLLQSARTVDVSGVINTRGGRPSQTGFITGVQIPTAPNQLNVFASGGDGSPGFYRVEAGSSVVFGGTGTPAWNPAVNSGALTDRDALSGSRSVWLLPPAGALPYWLRYELVADVNGQTVVFSDDPAVSALAANVPGPVQLRVQGAQIDPVTGQVVPATVGPWRSQLVPGTGSVNGDRAQVLRFDLVLDKTLGTVAVRELRLVWR